MGQATFRKAQDGADASWLDNAPSRIHAPFAVSGLRCSSPELHLQQSDPGSKPQTQPQPLQGTLAMAQHTSLVGDDDTSAIKLHALDKGWLQDRMRPIQSFSQPCL